MDCHHFCEHELLVFRVFMLVQFQQVKSLFWKTPEATAKTKLRVFFNREEKASMSSLFENMLFLHVFVSLVFTSCVHHCAFFLDTRCTCLDPGEVPGQLGGALQDFCRTCF